MTMSADFERATNATTMGSGVNKIRANNVERKLLVPSRFNSQKFNVYK